MGSGGQGSEVRGSSGARWAGNGWRQLCCQVEEQGAGVEVGAGRSTRFEMQGFRGIYWLVCPSCVPMCICPCVCALVCVCTGPGGGEHAEEEVLRAWQTKSPLWNVQWQCTQESPCGVSLMAQAV